VCLYLSQADARQPQRELSREIPQGLTCLGDTHLVCARSGRERVVRAPVDAMSLQGKVAMVSRSQSNYGPFLADAGCLLESMSDLQDTEIIPVTSNDLDADRQSFCRKARRD